MLEQLEFTIEQLAQVRAVVQDHTSRLGVGDNRAYDYVLAADEVAANTIVHSGGAGTLRLWRNGDCLTTEVRDRGTLNVQPAPSQNQPPTDLPGGRGLWLVHQLCDLVQTRTIPTEGTITRLHISRR